MDIGWGDWSGVGVRRLIAGGVAAVSVLSSRLGGDLLAGLQQVGELGLTVILLQQVAVSPVFGLEVSWVLLGYLSYAYTPEMYLGQFGAIVERPGFRAITAGFVVFFGVVLSRYFGTVPDAGIFALIPYSQAGVLATLTLGILASTALFSAYMYLWLGDRLATDGSASLTAMDAFSVEADRKHIERLDALPKSVQRGYLAIAEASNGALYMAPCLTLAFGLAAVNAFYPIPEVIVIVGLLASYTPIPARVRRGASEDLPTDIEVSVADTATDALQNIKGFILLFICLLAMAVSGLTFVIGIQYLIEALAVLRAGVVAIGELGQRLPTETAAILGAAWVALGVCLLLLVYGVYGLGYWFQQLKRLPAYVGYWEAHWEGASNEPSAPTVVRPPGLFIPGDGLLLVLAGLAWQTPALEPTRWVAIAFGLAWPLVIGAVIWSLAAMRDRQPQSHAGEDRSVLVAFLLQVAALSLVAPRFEAMGLDSPVGRLSFHHAAVLLVVLSYLPEVWAIADERGVIGAACKIAYVGVLFGYLLVILVVTGMGSPVVVTVVLLLFGVYAVTTYLEGKMAAEHA